MSVSDVPDVVDIQIRVAPAVVRRAGGLLPLVLSQDGRLSTHCSHSSIHLSTGIQSTYMKVIHNILK